MNDLVSIIIPLYNKENFIKKCIASLLHQSYKNIEIIVINDGSTDNSTRIMSQISNKKLFLYNISNGGVSHARNFGISKAKGKYIVFVDADDYVSENYIESLIRAKEDNVEYVVMGRKDVFKDKIVDVGLQEYSGAIESLPEEYYVNGFCHSVWGKLFIKEIIDVYNIKFPNINISEDSYFNLEYLKKIKKVKLINSKEYYYVHYGDNKLTSKIDYNYFNIYEDLYMQYKMFFQEKSMDYSEKIIYPQFYNLILKMIRKNTIKEIESNNIFNQVYYRTIVKVFANIKGNGFETVIKYLIVKRKWIILKLFLKFI